MVQRIQKLDDSVINKIAAGEIVDRPASVLKELLENAADAGANTVTVELEDGGKKRISVIDNGCGIPASDVPLALTRHATSKIKDVDDLFEIRTMGFRGEALASIASVSRLRLQTHAADADAICVISEGGVDPEVTPWNGPQGTQIHVQDLFFNVPARARFLKSPQVEYGHCLELVHAYALSNPQIKVVLKHNQKQTFIAEAVSTVEAGCVWYGEEAVRKRAQSVFGAATAKQMLYVKKDGDYGQCEGLVAPPGVDRSNSKMIFSFLNTRWVKDTVLRYGLLRGYHSHLLKGRFPVAVLWVQSDPGLVDVNVHPSKTELRFQYAKELQSIIAEGVRAALRSAEWTEPLQRTKVIAETLLKPQPVATWSNQSSHVASSKSTSISSPVSSPTLKQPVPVEPPPVSEPAAEPPLQQQSPQEPQRVKALSTSFVTEPVLQNVETDSRAAHFNDVSQKAPEKVAPSVVEEKMQTKKMTAVEDVADHIVHVQASLSTVENGKQKVVAGESVEVEEEVEQTQVEVRRQGAVSLFDDGPAPIAQQKSQPKVTEIAWDQLQYLGTFAQCYLMFQDQRQRLLCVDQHALHERILYEKLQADTSLLRQSQKLIVPEVIELTAVQVALLQESQDHLEKMGFALRFPSQHRCIEVHAVPSILGPADLVSVLEDLAKGDGHDDISVLAHHTLATIACHSAVRAGDELGEQQIQGLLAQAKDVDFFHNCPHGRRVLRWFSKRDVEGWFDRI